MRKFIIIFMCMLILFSVNISMNTINIKKWSKEELNILKNIYPTATRQEIVLALPNRKIHAIQEFARRNGIKRNKNIINKGRKGNLTPLLSETNEAYYWIGFLMADGYIHHPSSQIVLALDILDYKHLQKYSYFLQTDAPKIYTHNHSGFTSTSGKQARVSVAHKNICQQIIKKFGFKPQKTYNPPNISTLKYLLNNNKNKFISFLAGFIDGDGTIYPHHFQMENHPSWHNFHKFLVFNLKKYYKNFTLTKIYFTKKGYSHLYISGKNSLIEIKSDLCKLNVPILERKWNKI